tara:strand:- start:399 stop:539 length:141 start_codon:yes stop_codon:yes gene_type:complete
MDLANLKYDVSKVLQIFAFGFARVAGKRPVSVGSKSVSWAPAPAGA